MYCKNCGQKLADEDKFCNACGQKAETGIDNIFGGSSAANTAGEKSLYDFGLNNDKFDFSSKPEDIATPTPPTEEFNWNIHTFPGQEVTKTDETEFNWTQTASTIDSPARAATDTLFSTPDLNWDTSTLETPIQTQAQEVTPIKLEDELFGNLENKADNTRRQAEEIDKFFTFNKKNEEFQSLLDKEYDKIKKGNMLGDELDKANLRSEELFAVRKPEDPMEDLFASSGVVKGYQPKEFETNVLDKIDAAEAEKKVREDAARMIEEERAKAEAARVAEEQTRLQAEEQTRLQAEEQARLQAEEQARLQAEEQAKLQAEEQTRLQAEEQARLQAEEQARLQAEEQARLEAEEQARLQAEEQTRLQAEEQARLQAEAQQAQSITEPEPPVHNEAQEFDPMSDIFGATDSGDSLFQEDGLAENVTVDDIKTEEQGPAETIRAVDKAAILAGMASANKMVEMDKAAAAEASQKEEAAGIELPDFLGHPELEDELTFSGKPVIDEPLLENTMPEDGLSDAEFEDLFKAEPEQGDLFQDLAADQLAERLDKQAPILQGSEDQLNSDTIASDASAANAIVSSDKAKNNMTDPGEKGGKGRVVLKVFLVILIILLAMEIAGVAIKIIAPTSGAAKFIDKQLNKVITLVTGETDVQYNVLAATEDIRNLPTEDKTGFIKAEANKNKNGNIKSITYDASLKLDPEKKYQDRELSLTQELSDVVWHKNAAGKQVYYDQSTIGAIIAYNSQRVNMVNFNDSSVLNLMKEGTPLYNQVAKVGKKGSTMTFTSLKIGQIRQAGKSFYLWVSEETQDTNEGSSTAQKVYELQPVGKTMKVVGEMKI